MRKQKVLLVIVEHYLCCVKVGVCATAQAIFAKFSQFQSFLQDF